jgi:pimeloyl-ACP methyl ester carboxylesterase
VSSQEEGETNQARISLQAIGGTGPNALFLHGFGSDRWSWVATQPAIANVATIFALDLPGHGESGVDVGDGSVSTLAGRIAVELDRHGLRALHMIGHSLGGGLALLLASDRPDLVASLSLIAPAGLGRGVDPAFLSAYPNLENAEEAEALLRRLVVRPRLIAKPLIARVLEQLQKPGAKGALRKVADGLANSAQVLEGAAGTVAARGLPRLLIWGDSDEINPMSPERSAAFGGEFFVAPAAAHLPQIESVRLVNDVIANFLRRLSA